ncbi:dihydroxy-acid dehydratase [Colletotrichum tofieldiae]|nr:dihydroxy-acid dehydratase [Colletotrichum tofieldiae]
MALRIDDPDLEVTPDSVLVLQNIGPVGNPARLSRSARYASPVRRQNERYSRWNHRFAYFPEAADPESVLGIVRSGDIITCDVEQRIIKVEISDDEIQRRIAEKKEALIKEEEGGGSNAPWVAKKRIRGYRGSTYAQSYRLKEGLTSISSQRMALLKTYNSYEESPFRL